MKCKGCGNTVFLPTPDKPETVVYCTQCRQQQLICPDCVDLKKEVSRLWKISQCEHGIPWDTDCDICNSENKSMAKFINRHYNPVRDQMEILTQQVIDALYIFESIFKKQKRVVSFDLCYGDGTRFKGMTRKDAERVHDSYVKTQWQEGI